MWLLVLIMFSGDSSSIVNNGNANMYFASQQLCHNAGKQWGKELQDSSFIKKSVYNFIPTNEKGLAKIYNADHIEVVQRTQHELGFKCIKLK